MNTEPQFVKRLKSFGWRLGVFIVVGAVSWISANLQLLELPIWIQTIVALVLGEVTKYLNSRPTFSE